MSWRLGAVVGGLMAVAGLCSCCVWFLQPWTRFSYTFDLQGGRTLRVWSIHGTHGGVLDNDGASVDYQVTQAGKVIVDETYIGIDDGGDYHFDIAFADGGNLACVYEPNRCDDDSWYILMFDITTGESWPGVDGRWQAAVQRKWQERYRRVCADNPKLHFPAGFR